MRVSIPYAQPAPTPTAHDTPDEIKLWLGARGWRYAGDDGITGDELWQHSSHTGYFTWAEAVAYEFYRFINLGAHNG